MFGATILRRLNWVLAAALCVVAVLAVGTAQAGNGLIAFYAFDDNANDSSGNGFHATNTGMTYITNGSGKAISSTGVAGNRVDVPLNLGPGVSNRTTFGCWAKAVATSGIQSIAWTEGDWGRRLGIDNRNQDNAWEYSAMAGYSEEWWYARDGDRILRQNVGGDAVDQSWQFAAVSYDAANRRTTLYNNDNVYTMVDGSPYCNWDWSTFQIGATASNFDNYQGALDNFFVFDDVLSKTQIDSIRTATTDALKLSAAQAVGTELTANRKWKIDIQANGGNECTGIDNTAGNGVDEWNIFNIGDHYVNVTTPTIDNLITTSGAASTVDFHFVNTLSYQLEEGFDQTVSGTTPSVVRGYNWNTINGIPVQGDGVICNVTFSGMTRNMDWEIQGMEPGRSYKIAMVSTFPPNPDDGNHVTAFDTDGDGAIDSTMRSESKGGAHGEFVVIADESGVVRGRHFPRSPWGTPGGWGAIAGMNIEELPQAPAVTPTDFYLGGVKEDGDAPVNAYNFDGSGGNGATLTDRLGTSDGTLSESDGSLLNGGTMYLSGTSGFGDLPNGILTGAAAGGDSGDVTLEFWVARRNIGTWYSRIYSFGDATTKFEYEQYRARGDSSGRPARHYFRVNDETAEYNDGSWQYNETLDEEIFVHLAVTYSHDGDGDPTISIYNNGALEFEAELSNELSTINDVNSFLGRSQSGNYVAATYDEFRLYDHALSHDQIVKNFEYGPDWSGVKGDVDVTWDVNADDIDLEVTAIGASSTQRRHDVEGDGGTADVGDLDELVQVVLNTRYGDVDLQGDVDVDDYSTVTGVAWQQSSGQGWADGDTHGAGGVPDGDVDVDDAVNVTSNWQWIRGAGPLSGESSGDGMEPGDAGAATGSGTVTGDGSILLTITGANFYKVFIGDETGAETFDSTDLLQFDGGQTAPNWLSPFLTPQDHVNNTGPGWQGDENWAEITSAGDFIGGLIPCNNHDFWVNVALLPEGYHLWLQFGSLGNPSTLVEIDAPQVPEPGTLVLLGSALLGLVLVCYRRKK